MQTTCKQIINLLTAQKKEQPYITLSYKLNEYGLDPKHWTIQKINTKKYKIVNKEDSSFYFLGITTLKQNTCDWEKIILASL